MQVSLSPRPAAGSAKGSPGPFGSFKQVDNVILCRRGDNFEGTLFLAEHHVVFSWLPLDSQDTKARPRQIWITYPIISRATLRILPSAARQRSAIRLRCRDFTFVAFQFADDTQARDVFDKIKARTCALGTIDRLLAFSYRPPPEEAACNGWRIYDARREYRRMGIGPKETDKGWRVSEINHDYAYSPTYPSLLVVPSSISDNVLKHGGAYRSRARIPVLSYLHSVNNCSISRSSQPMVGLFKGKRNMQDERLVAAIFSTSQPQHGSESDLDTDGPIDAAPMSEPNAEDVEKLASMAATDGQHRALHTSASDSDIKSAKVYGAQQRNLIIDARPFLNARANQAAGKGSENMDFYKDATINFLGIDNIHVMRDSLNKVVEALAHTDYTKLAPDQELLTRSKWLKYIRLLLRGTDLVARQIGINHSHVLIHCSDGWDRTSQISALSQLCLDPYYRTLEGFIVLVEKDWLSFGHMFRRRCAPLGSEKWFEIEDERPNAGRANDGSPHRSNISNSASNHNINAFNNALMSARGFFSKKDEEPEVGQEGHGSNSTSGNSAGTAREERYKTHLDDVSPIFHQFLDATWQLMRQHPTRFEFSERFLRRLLYHLYACQYGTFLHDSEAERIEASAKTRTASVWDYFLARREQFLNPLYDPRVDDKVAGQERLLFPDTSKVRWWAEVFGRTDEEMNGTAAAPAVSLPRGQEEAITGVESADVVVGTAVDGAAGFESNDPAFMGGAADRLMHSLSSISLTGRASAPLSRTSTPNGGGGKRVDESDAGSAQAASPSHGRVGLSAQAFARDSAFRDL